MTKTRANRKADDLDGIIAILSEGKYPEDTWVGKNYSKADLLRDLASTGAKEQALTDEVVRLREALGEAADKFNAAAQCIAIWGSYASQHHQKEYGLQDDITTYRQDAQGIRRLLNSKGPADCDAEKEG